MDSTRAAQEAESIVKKKIKPFKKREEGSLCSLLSSALAGATEGNFLLFIFLPVILEEIFPLER